MVGHVNFKVGKMIYLREVTEADIDITYKWANDPITRQNSFNTSYIKFEEHAAWFERMLSRQDVKMYIMVDGSVPVGQIRIKIINGEGEISYSIAPDKRGKGYGRKIVSLLILKVKDSFPHITKLIAEVKPDNLPSRAIFERKQFGMKIIRYELSLCKD